MDRKLLETVFFLKDLSVNEEYKIVNSRIEEDPELQIINENKKHVQQTNGNVFYKCSKALYSNNELNYKSLDKYSNNRLNSLLSALLFLSPVANFLENMASKVNKKVSEIPAVTKMLELLQYFKSKHEVSFPGQSWMRLDTEISPLFENIFYLFDEFLKLWHDDLLKKYKFTEDAWEDPDLGLRVKVKHLYPDFSPVVDIFHFKVRKPAEKSNVTKIEYLNSLEVDCSKTSIQERLSQFDGRGRAEKSKGAVVKYPHVLSIKLINSEDASMPENISILGKKYSLKTLVCTGEDGPSYFACVKGKEGFVRMGSGVTRIKSDTLLMPLLAFYVATNYDFNF